MKVLSKCLFLAVFFTSILCPNHCISQENDLKDPTKKIVKKNDKVKIQYTGTLKNGTIVDKTNNGEPIEFVVGQGQVLPGFESQVLGMKLNEEKKFTVKAKDTFGVRDKSLIQKLPKLSHPNTPNIEKGAIITIFDKSGKSIPAKVIAIQKETITVDLNHPLAGEDLSFSVKVVGIE
jgi:FKBP-type peptidyl-prolyl cis-trans isomerase 2